MTSYFPVQALSPTENRRDEVETRGPGVGNSEDEWSHSEEDDIDEQAGLFSSRQRNVGQRQRRPYWPICVFAFACVGTIFCLAWLALSVDISGISSPSSSKETPSVPLRRPDEDYILDKNWDFAAPRQLRTYNWTIIDIEGDPDGVRKDMMTINGQFPGPLIEVNEGDIIQVNVHNRASNATTIHWHGIFQNGTNWMDGAAGVTQCPIASGGSYSYKFNVTGQAGTYFYHGHQGVQALSGLVGPLVIHSRDEAAHQPIRYSSDRVVLLQDWYYDSSDGLMRDVLSPGVEDAPVPNTALLNGVNRADCSSHPTRLCSNADNKPFPSLDLAPYQGHRLRFLNVGGFAWFQVAVDEHDSLPVIEVDGTTVEPTNTSSLVIAPGQRYSAVLTTDQQSKEAFWLRARMIKSCFATQTLPEDGIDEAKAIIRYHVPSARHGDHAPPPLPTTASKLEYLPTCKDMSSTTSFSPSPALPAPAHADHSWHLRVNLAIGDWRLQRGVMNSSSLRPNLESPTLHRIVDGLSQTNDSFTPPGILSTAFDPTSELVVSNSNNGAPETVDIVLQNMDENSHPFHLHGAQTWVLASGHGYFPGYEALGFQPDGKGLLPPITTTIIANPLKRDTATAEGFGWVLLRFVADNPGIWLFHCHVLWHSEAGMGMLFLSRVEEMRGWEIPGDARALCEVPGEELGKGAVPGDEEFVGFHGDDESR